LGAGSRDVELIPKLQQQRSPYYLRRKPFSDMARSVMNKNEAAESLWLKYWFWRSSNPESNLLAKKKKETPKSVGGRHNWILTLPLSI
jgi:hypothetical protein